jgi:hypothetical protein
MPENKDVFPCSVSLLPLRRKPVSERKVAVLLYGFPPGVGATGTAALLNVPRSLQALLGAMKVGGPSYLTFMSSQFAVHAATHKQPGMSARAPTSEALADPFDLIRF